MVFVWAHRKELLHVLYYASDKRDRERERLYRMGHYIDAKRSIGLRSFEQHQPYSTGGQIVDDNTNVVSPSRGLKIALFCFSSE